MSDITLDQIRDELLVRAYAMAVLHDLQNNVNMVLHYEATIGLCRIHVAIDIKEVRSDDHDD